MLLSAHPVTTLIQIPCQDCHTPAERCKAWPVQTLIELQVKQNSDHLNDRQAVPLFL